MRGSLDDVGARHGTELSSLSRDCLESWERFLEPLREEAFDLPPGSPDEGQQIAAYYWWLFPNTMLNIYPWGVSVNVVRPLAVDRTKVSFLAYVWDPSKLDRGAGAGLDRVEREDEAIVEAATRPTMRFVALKSKESQARALLFRSRDLLVRQRAQLITSLRGHLAEYGLVVARGKEQIRHLARALEDPETDLPEILRTTSRMYLEQIGVLTGRIVELDKLIRTEAARGPASARLQTMPGIGPISAMAIETFAPPMETFRRGRDFSAWIGLVPRQHSSGGKDKLGSISKQGDRCLRSLFTAGALAVIRYAKIHGTRHRPWLTALLVRRPTKVAAIALAAARCAADTS